MQRINQKWAEAIREKLAMRAHLDVSLSFRPAAKWLVLELTEKDIPFKVYQLGLGVVRITTETNVCPCCKAVIAVREVKR